MARPDADAPRPARSLATCTRDLGDAGEGRSAGARHAMPCAPAPSESRLGRRPAPPATYLQVGGRHSTCQTASSPSTGPDARPAARRAGAGTVGCLVWAWSWHLTRERPWHPTHSRARRRRVGHAHAHRSRASSRMTSARRDLAAISPRSRRDLPPCDHTRRGAGGRRCRRRCHGHTSWAAPRRATRLAPRRAVRHLRRNATTPAPQVRARAAESASL